MTETFQSDLLRRLPVVHTSPRTIICFLVSLGRGLPTAGVGDLPCVSVVRVSVVHEISLWSDLLGVSRLLNPLRGGLNAVLIILDSIEPLDILMIGLNQKLLCVSIELVQVLVVLNVCYGFLVLQVGVV